MDEDDLFSRLAELFTSSGPVNWKLSAEVIKNLAGKTELLDPRLTEEFRELSLAARLRLEPVLPVAIPGGELQPVDRRTWALANQQSFRFLIEPLAAKLGSAPAGMGPLDAILGQLVPSILGMQAGSMVGMMSHRVLGQFDVGLPAMDQPGMFLVVPNVAAFAADHDLDDQQVRLWAALHEVTHLALMHVDWVRGHFVSLIHEYFSGVELNLSSITEQLGSLDDPEQLQRMMDQAGGFGSLLAGDRQPEHLARIQAFTALLEGYADHVVGIGAGDLLPDADRLAEAMTRRRAEPTQAELFLQQLVGLELHRHRARAAAGFCAEVARRWGGDALDRVWADPQYLPTLAELDDPVGWAARVLLEG